MKSSILIVENSDYFHYFEQQVSGTLPVDKLKEYIIFDKADTVISVLAFEEPEVIDITEEQDESAASITSLAVRP